MLILLLTAVLPMLAVRAIQAVSIYRLQSEVGASMRERLNQQAEEDMLRTVNGYARSLDQEADLVFALLQIQAGAVEHRLTGPVPVEHDRVPTAREFQALQEQDPVQWQVVSSARHAVYNEEGRFDPLLVSYATQVVLVPPNRLQQSAARDDIARLADMDEVYREIYEKSGQSFLWQYTTLASGLHFSYPAKANFPPGYLPQQRSWYRQAIAAGQAIPTRPMVDASTRQLVITFAQPVYGPDNNLLAVTAIDLPVSRLLDPNDLNTNWAEQAQVVVVSSGPARFEQSQDEGSPALSATTDLPADVYVVADINQQRDTRPRMQPTETVPFDLPSERQAVVQDLLAARSGVRRVSIDGQDRMIAYGQVGVNEQRPVYALILVPAPTIFEPAESAVARIESELRDSLVNTGAILLVLLLFVGVVAYALSFRLTRPIVEIANASRRVAEGNLDTRVELDQRRDELGQLGKAFNDMVPALRDRLKIRQSLAVAMQVQQSLLPSGPPKMPGLDIAGHSEYCDETGGDYYDFIELDQLGPDTVAIAVGDVTGHGIAAALLMATGRALIRSYANTTGSLGEVFTAVNKQLCDSEFTGRFMTLMYLIVQNQPDDTGCVPIRYLSAGHDPVIVYRPAEDVFIELAGRDIPLGIDANWAYHEENSTALRPGDILVVGTDGIWECFNPKGEQFGKDRMRDAIRTASAGTSDEIGKAISQACVDWRGQREQNDDITLVVVKLLGAQAE